MAVLCKREIVSYFDSCEDLKSFHRAFKLSFPPPPPGYVDLGSQPLSHGPVLVHGL